VTGNFYHIFLSHLTTEEGVSYSRGRDHCQSCIGVHSKQAGLLQHGTSKPTSLYCCTITACSKCRCITPQRPPTKRSRDVSSSRPTLAPNQASCHIYIVCTDAPGAYRQQSVVSLRSCDGHSQYTVPEATSICGHKSLFTTQLKFGERCFSHAGPKAWNALPAELQDLTDHNAFKRQLKTFLFERAFTT